MPKPKEEDIKVRVPATMKIALTAIADSRLTTLSEVARQALLDYVTKHGVSAAAAELRETSKPAPMPAAKPVVYPSAKRNRGKNHL